MSIKNKQEISSVSAIDLDTLLKLKSVYSSGMLKCFYEIERLLDGSNIEVSRSEQEEDFCLGCCTELLFNGCEWSEFSCPEHWELLETVSEYHELFEKYVLRLQDIENQIKNIGENI